MKVKFVKKKRNNPFCRVSPINATSDALIVDLVLSERLHLWVIYCGGQPYSISTNRWHRGRSTTSRNQQHENFVINYPLSLLRSDLRRMVGPTNIHLVRILDTHRTIEDCRSDEFLEIKGRGDKEIVEVAIFFLSSIKSTFWW